MKTTIKNQGRKMLLACVLMMISIHDSKAQITAKAIEIASDVTGSGLGGNICIGATVSKDKSALNFGLNFQRKKFNLSGIQMNYRYTVFSSDVDKFDVFFLANLTFHAAAYISNKSIKIEKKCAPENAINYNTLSLKVIESYLGFGAKYNMSKKLSVIGSIGFGGYETLNKDYDLKMYREKSSIGLRFKVGLAYNLK